MSPTSVAPAETAALENPPGAGGDRLKELAAKVRQLPTLPTVYIRVVELMRDPNSSAADVGRVVSNDQAIAAKLLRVVNSSFYGFSQRITTVSRAITVIGFRGLRDLVLTLSALRLARSWDAGRSFDDRLFWSHAVGVAACARATAAAAGGVDPEEAFTAGLLHDIGKLALYWFLKDEFVEVAWRAEEAGTPLWEEERRRLGFTHAQLGHLLAARWQLPPELADGVANHHAPACARCLKLTGVTHVADILARAMMLGGESNERVPSLDVRAWDALEMDKSRIEKIMQSGVQEFGKAKEFLSIVLET